MKNLVQRTFSGIIYLILIIGSLYLGKFIFGAILLLFSTIALHEFYRLTNRQESSIQMITGLATGALIILNTFLVFSGILTTVYLSFNLFFVMLLFLAALFSVRKDAGRILGSSLLGIIYIVLPLAFMLYIIFPASNNYEYTHRILLGILTMIWINDTGAYIVGITMGRHRLFKRISPKKSWEGVVAGTLFTFVPAFWMAEIMNTLSQKDWLILAGIVSVFGVLGDLFESMFKRDNHVKDSGSLIPGHGGMLDRIDSMLFIMPVAFIYLLINHL